MKLVRASVRSTIGRQNQMNLTGASITRLCFWCAAALLGFLQAWSGRMTIYADPISFLDMGDYLIKREWSAVINAYWNPLYAGLLGLTMAILKPSAYWEYPVVHFVLFFIFLFALGCFDFFLRQMFLLRHQQNAANELSVPEWTWMTIGYMLFLWSSLQLISLVETDPDILVAAFFFLACGLLVQIRRGSASWLTYLALGLTLGLAYLTKAIMFPVSLLCLATATLMSARSQRGAVRRVSSPALFSFRSRASFIVALSIKIGKPQLFPRAQRSTPLWISIISCLSMAGVLISNTEVFPTRRIRYSHDPPRSNLPVRVPGSYPVWYDPSYWLAGAKPDYRLGEMAKNFVLNLGRTAATLVAGLHGAIIVGLFVLLWVSGRRWLFLTDVAAFWFLLIPALAPIAMLAILHILTRYIAGFVVVALSCLFFSIKMPPTSEARRVFAAVAILLPLMFVGPQEFKSLLDFLQPQNTARNRNAEAIRELQQMGLHPGDTIASLEFSQCAVELEGTCWGPAYWARLGGLRIVADVYYFASTSTGLKFPGITEFLQGIRGNNFWDADIEQQEKLIGALAKTGARAVVSLQEPRGSHSVNWQKVGDTGYYIRWLEPATTASHSN